MRVDWGEAGCARRADSAAALASIPRQVVGAGTKMSRRLIGLAAFLGDACDGLLIRILGSLIEMTVLEAENHRRLGPRSNFSP